VEAQEEYRGKSEMEYIIRKATQDDTYRVGYVHYKSWLETYRQIIDDDYLDNLTLESRINKVHLYVDKCVVCEHEGKVVAFASFNPSRDDDLVQAIEVSAIYVLKEHKNKGVGKRLINLCLQLNMHYDLLSLWVSKANENAITAYKRMGLNPDGKETKYKIGNSEIEVIRMVKQVNEI